MDIKRVAEWMTREFKGQTELFQAEAAEMILLLFGEEFVSDGRAKYRGSLKINKDVRRMFRAMNPNAYWDNDSFSWKMKTNDPIEPVCPDNDKDPNFRALVEQAEYLLGVLYGDKAQRMDNDLTRDISSEIDPYGPGTRDFWRGVVETGGYFNVEEAGRYGYPKFKLEGGYRLLRKFLDFCEQELAPRALGPQMKWDADGKLNHQAMGCFISLSSQRAQDVVRLLYVGATVSRDSFRQRLTGLYQWSPKR